MPDVRTFRDVALMSGEDTLPDLSAPWIDVFNTSSANATTLLNTFYDAPLIGLQQLIANDSGYLQDFFNDPTSSTVTSISHEMQVNLAAVLQGFTLQDATADTTSTVVAHTLDSGHQFLFHEVPGFIPAADDPALVAQILDFLASPSSGFIMGMLGPEISPLVALGDSITAGDSFSETLANMYGAFLNGADLNLDTLIPAIEQLDVLPPGYNIEDLDIAFGGLLTPGDTAAGVGGSIFNSVGIELTGTPIGDLGATSDAIGPIGALEGWAQTIGSLLGWDGSGSPLADVTLPTIPTDFLDAGSSAATAATDLSGLWQDLVAAF